MLKYQLGLILNELAIDLDLEIKLKSFYFDNTSFGKIIAH